MEVKVMPVCAKCGGEAVRMGLLVQDKTGQILYDHLLRCLACKHEWLGKDPR